RRCLIQGGQRLSRHIRKENREADLEEKLRHIEQFCPILVECLCRITKEPASRKKKANEGLIKLLGRDINVPKKELKEAHEEVKIAKEKGKIHDVEEAEAVEEKTEEAAPEEATPTKKGKGKGKDAAKKEEPKAEAKPEKKAKKEEDPPLKVEA